ncbi:FxSxx-COOH cyclophane-containing RiPP peptide [Actinoplanes sp. NPDC049802]|uniref:FxSxx-COOH cyclophane-containing RiPP peptide n=1 Tax=Actinoplanes sp. NPDC049802 TaxID=3154742 RepID=UPI0034009886
MHEEQDDGDPAEWRSVMIDLSGSSLADLVARAGQDDSALARALRRVTEDGRSGEPIAGFNSAL